MTQDVFICSMICLCVHVCVNWDGYVLNWALPALERLPNFVRKPAYACLPCQGGVYASAYLITDDRAADLAFAATVLAVVGFNAVIALFMRLIEAVENLETFEK